MAVFKSDIPDRLGHGSCGFCALENMTGESLDRWMLGYEAEVPVVSGMESTEGDVFQRVEVVYAGLFITFVLQ
jgi:hypothetical protein